MVLARSVPEGIGARRLRALRTTSYWPLLEGRHRRIADILPVYAALYQRLAQEDHTGNGREIHPSGESNSSVSYIFLATVICALSLVLAACVPVDSGSGESTQDTDGPIGQASYSESTISERAPEEAVEFGVIRQELVGGSEVGQSAGQFEGVTFVTTAAGNCTGTFVHPQLILTAAHCLPPCGETIDTGCVTIEDDESIHADGYTGADGAVKATAMTTVAANPASVPAFFTVDFVYFPVAGESGYDTPPDVALLRTTNPFNGPVIPTAHPDDLPTNSNISTRFEFTWPMLLGYSNNRDLNPEGRRAVLRVGNAEVENDIEANGRAFKLDGNNGPGGGVRTCPGDSGGPVIWNDGFGGLMVGGVISFGDAWGESRCPSDDAESGIAFIPAAFLDRVAATDSVCQGATWWGCTDGAVANNYTTTRLRLEHRGTRVEQCGESQLSIGTVTVTNVAGSTPVSRGNPVPWTCGISSAEETELPILTDLVVVRKAPFERQVYFDSYWDTTIPRSTTGSTVDLGTLRRVGSTTDACSAVNLVSFDVQGATVEVAPGDSRLFDFGSLSGRREIRWSCGPTGERSANDQDFQFVLIERGSNGAISWTFYVQTAAPATGSPDINSLTRVGSTRDACSGSNSVSFDVQGSSVSIAASETRVFDFGESRREFAWLCGSSLERVANDAFFQFVRIERAGNGAISWTFYRVP